MRGLPRIPGFRKPRSTPQQLGAAATVVQSVSAWATVAADQAGTGDATWTSPASATGTNDGVYATAGEAPAGVFNYTDGLRLTGYGFAIPANATILGVALVVWWRMTTTTENGFVYTALVQGGVELGPPVSPPSRSTPSYLGSTVEHSDTIGGSSDLWSATLTPAIVNSSTFGVDLYGSAGAVNLCNYGVDAAQLIIYYSVPSGGTTTLTPSDTGSGSDTTSDSVADTKADTATGADAQSKTATDTKADTSTGVDSLSKSSTAAKSDTATGADAQSKTGTKSLSDTTTGADSISKFVTEKKSDTATGSDSTTIRTTETLAIADTGNVSDSQNKAATDTKTDAATGTDAISKTATKTQADTGTGVDALSKSATKAVSDTSTASDLVSKAATESRTDTASGADVATKAGSKVVADSGTGADATGKVATYLPADVGSGTDAAAKAAATTFSDSGVGTDTFTWGSRFTVNIADSATGADNTTFTETTVGGGSFGPFSTPAAAHTGRRGLRRRQRPRVPVHQHVIAVAETMLATDSVSFEIRYDTPLYVDDILSAADDLQNEVVDLLMAGVI